jgi:hypothetical protein
MKHRLDSKPEVYTSIQPPSEKDALRERLAADIDRFFAEDGHIKEVPAGVSGEAQVRLKKDRGRVKYDQGEKSKGWRDYDRMKYNQRYKQ